MPQRLCLRPFSHGEKDRMRGVTLIRYRRRRHYLNSLLRELTIKLNIRLQAAPLQLNPPPDGCQAYFVISAA